MSVLPRLCPSSLLFCQCFLSGSICASRICIVPLFPRGEHSFLICLYIYIYTLDSHRRLTAPVKPHEAKFEAVQPAAQ